MPPTQPASPSSSTQPPPVSTATSSSRKASKVPVAVLLAQHRSGSSPATPIQSDCDSPLLPPVPEPTLLRDILYILQGIDGQFMRFKPSLPVRQGHKWTYWRGENVVDSRGGADEPPPEGWGGGAE
ncbi:hypothetical protein JCM11641_005450 [Rhodosporidiobolus odoratus]